jgi:hypothetical protein
MQKVITIGRRLVPAEQIALVEPFDPEANPSFKPDKPFKARVVLINRDNVLSEASPQEFADGHGFRMLTEDNVATNPAIAFRVETFTPTDEFKPTKPFLTRLRWRDQDGNDQSKLLLTKPETVIAVALRGGSEAGADRKEPPRRPPGARALRRRERRLEPVRA